MSKLQVDINSDAICCPICTDILHHATETCCGHAFCELCIRRWLESHPTTCPLCKKNPQPVHPSFTLRAICEQYYKKNPTNHHDLVTREKELGNEFYSKKQYWKAIEHYTAAMGGLCETDAMRGVLYNNRSQCYIKLFKYSNALADCEKAILLKISNDNLVKARMRKGNCLMHLGDVAASHTEFKLALQLDSDGAGVFKSEIEKCMSMLPPPQELPNSIPDNVINPDPPPNPRFSSSLSPSTSTSPPTAECTEEVGRSGRRGRGRRSRRGKPGCSLM